MSSNVQDRRIALQIKLARKKHTALISDKLCLEKVPFSILEDHERVALFSNIWSRAKAAKEDGGEFRFGCFSEVVFVLGKHFGDLRQSIVFSAANPARSTFVSVEIREPSYDLEKIYQAFSKNVRLYDPRSLKTAAIEYDKYDNAYVVEFDMWGRLE